jgi:hypothetical protein
LDLDLGSLFGVRAAALLFVPALGDGPFRFPLAAGGASELEGVPTLSAGAGVAAVSTGVSAVGEGSMTLVAGGVLADEDDLVDASADGSVTWGNLVSRSGDSLSTATRLLGGSLGVMMGVMAAI